VPEESTNAPPPKEKMVCGKTERNIIKYKWWRIERQPLHPASGSGRSACCCLVVLEIKSSNSTRIFHPFNSLF